MYTLTFILNLGRMDRIGYVDQFVMAYGGLRGGIAFSLCRLTCLQDVPAIKGVVNNFNLSDQNSLRTGILTN